MSRPQEPHRPFFPFGNPFQMMSPKGSQLSPTLHALISSFEVSLAERLRKLEPKDADGVLSLSWMKLAMESLCQTHKDVKNLIATLDLPVSNWDEKGIDVYLDISVKLLDISIAFSSELSRLNQGHLLLQCALHNLESSSPEQFLRARSSLDGWREQVGSKNPRLENCCSYLEGLMETLNLPKVKNSAKGKVLMRAMYGVKVQTIFVCSVFLAAFSGSSKKLLELEVPETYLWAQVFTQVRRNVNGMIRDLLSSSGPPILEELEAVDRAVKKVYPVTEDGLMSPTTTTTTTQKESFQNMVSELRSGADKLAHGLDLLGKEVDGFFQIVLGGRDALLSNLRASCTATDRILVKNVVGKAVV